MGAHCRAWKLTSSAAVSCVSSPIQSWRHTIQYKLTSNARQSGIEGNLIFSNVFNWVPNRWTPSTAICSCLSSKETEALARHTQQPQQTWPAPASSDALHLLQFSTAWRRMECRLTGAYRLSEDSAFLPVPLTSGCDDVFICSPNMYRQPQQSLIECAALTPSIAPESKRPQGRKYQYMEVPLHQNP